MKNTPNKYWNKFYNIENRFNKPSNFAKFIKKKILKKTDMVLDVATGNGRDAFYFSKYSKTVYGIDKSDVAIRLNKKKTKLENIKNLKFLNISSGNIKKLKKKKISLIYARFFLHAVNEKVENKFLKDLRKYFTKTLKIALEFRTIKDDLFKKGKKISKNERVTSHYRRFIDFKDFEKKIIKYNLKIIFKRIGQNLSKTTKENPHLCRVILISND